MSYGIANRGNHAWTLSEAESRPFIQRALEAGINFFDTANVYSDGTSEEILGRAFEGFHPARRSGDRDQWCMAGCIPARTAPACRAGRS